MGYLSMSSGKSRRPPAASHSAGAVRVVLPGLERVEQVARRVAVTAFGVAAAGGLVDGQQRLLAGDGKARQLPRRSDALHQGVQGERLVAVGRRLVDDARDRALG